MAQFKYTLPSGTKFTMNAPDGTTQLQADRIFYEQVAAGTFVGYNKGDTLTRPAEAISNLGISRLERETAGVSDEVLLAIASMAPVVTTFPTLSKVPVTNPITTANFIQVNSNPEIGMFSQKPAPIGDLTPEQTQAIMAGVANAINQAANVMTREFGVGKYGFNAQQLERVAYIKPGYAQMYCPLNANTQENPPNFIEFMNSPTPWTGLDNVYSVDDILNNEALQNAIQEKLMSNTYTSFVSLGIIKPSAATVTTPTVSTGKVYTNSGELTAATSIDILAAPIVPAVTNMPNSTPLGVVPPSITGLGTNAVATYQAGLSSLTTGAVNITPGIASSGSQLAGMSSGLLGGAATALATAALTSTLKGDVGALLVNGSKFGDKLTALWADGSPDLTKLGGTIEGAFDKAGELATGALNNLEGLATGALDSATAQLNNITTSAMDLLGKASQFSVNFSDFNLSGLVAGVEPAAGFSNTVDRKTVDAAVNRVIGSNKIFPPIYELPSFETLAAIADFDKANSVLAQLKSLGDNASGQLSALVDEASKQASGAINQVSGQAKNLFG